MFPLFSLHISYRLFVLTIAISKSSSHDFGSLRINTLDSRYSDASSRTQDTGIIRSENID